MLPRKPLKPRPRKSRVSWSAAERDTILDLAVAIQADRPDLAGLPLLRAVMGQLDPSRRRTVLTLSQVPWFEAALASRVRSRPDTPDGNWLKLISGQIAAMADTLQAIRRELESRRINECESKITAYAPVSAKLN